MTNKFNPDYISDLMNAAWEAGDIMMLALDEDYVFDDAHTFLDDIPGGVRIGEAVLPTPTETGAVFDAGDMVIPSAGGIELQGYWIYHNSGVEATSRLILWLSHNADGTIISGTTTTAGISIPFSPLGIFSIATVPS